MSTRGIVIAVLAALLVGFSIGLVSGILCVRWGTPDRPFATMGHGPLRHGMPPGLGPMGMGPGFRGEPGPLMERLDRDLGLSAEQHARVLAVLQRVRAEHLALRESTRVEIERQLTEAQRVQYRALADRYRRTWHGPADRTSGGEGRPPGKDPTPQERP